MTRIKCPRCRRETQWNDNPHRPFCSEKCRLIDLGNWADENYRIPSDERPMSEDKIVSLHTDPFKE